MRHTRVYIHTIEVDILILLHFVETKLDAYIYIYIYIVHDRCRQVVGHKTAMVIELRYITTPTRTYLEHI